MRQIRMIVAAGVFLSVSTPSFAVVGYRGAGVMTHPPLVQAAKYKGAKGGCEFKFKAGRKEYKGEYKCK